MSNILIRTLSGALFIVIRCYPNVNCYWIVYDNRIKRVLQNVQAGESA